MMTLFQVLPFKASYGQTAGSGFFKSKVVPVLCITKHHQQGRGQYHRINCIPISAATCMNVHTEWEKERQ